MSNTSTGNYWDSKPYDLYEIQPDQRSVYSTFHPYDRGFRPDSLEKAFKAITTEWGVSTTTREKWKNAVRPDTSPTSVTFKGVTESNRDGKIEVNYEDVECWTSHGMIFWDRRNQSKLTRVSWEYELEGRILQIEVEYRL